MSDHVVAFPEKLLKTIATSLDRLRNADGSDQMGRGTRIRPVNNWSPGRTGYVLHSRVAAPRHPTVMGRCRAIVQNARLNWPKRSRSVSQYD